MSVAAVVTKIAITTARLYASLFGVPFSDSYHHDIDIDYYIKSEATNRPPQIFGYGEGFNLAGTGGIYSVQCAVSHQFSPIQNTFSDAPKLTLAIRERQEMWNTRENDHRR